MIVEHDSSVGWSEIHDGAFFVDVVEVNSIIVFRVEDSGVDFVRASTWCEFQRVVVVGHNTSQGSLSGDTHRPGAHVTRSRAWAGKAYQGRKIRNIGRAKCRGDTQKVLGTNQLVTFDRVAFVQPGSSDDISRV